MKEYLIGYKTNVDILLSLPQTLNNIFAIWCMFNKDYTLLSSAFFVRTPMFTRKSLLTFY